MQPGLFTRIKDLRGFLTPAGLLFTASLLYFLWAATVGWNNPLLDRHGFRQTQTAISAYYMVGKLPTLAYETPVLGPPWSIPFEFPLYQWLVAAIVTALKTPLDQTGRFVSVFFFLLTLIPASQVLATLKFSGQIRLVMLSLLLASPFYIYWSRAFMIESTALFLGIAYLSAVVSISHQAPRTWIVAAALVFGVLAALVKITTFVPIFLAALFFLGARLLRQFRQRGLSRRALFLHSVLYVLIAGIPVAGCLWWTHFADEQKQLNLLGQFLTSRQLASWNFGTLRERLSSEIWYRILGRESEVFGHHFVVVGALLGLCLARRRWREYATCVFLYLSAPLVFTNLHYIHDYYAFANNIFLVTGGGVCLAGLMERGGWYKNVALVGLLVILLTEGRFYFHSYNKEQRISKKMEIVELGEAVQRMTQSADVIIVLGCRWSAEVPYYCRRRALMVPGWAPTQCPRSTDLDQLKNYPIGALIVHHSADFDPNLFREMIKKTGFHLNYQRTYQNGSYDVYTMRENERSYPE